MPRVEFVRCADGWYWRICTSRDTRIQGGPFGHENGARAGLARHLAGVQYGRIQAAIPSALVRREMR